MKRKVRVIQMKGTDGMRDVFVYGNWYGLVNGKAIYHAENKPRKGMAISELIDSYVSQHDNGRNSTAEEFEKSVLETEAYLKSAHGSCRHAFDLELGTAM